MRFADAAWWRLQVAPDDQPENRDRQALDEGHRLAHRRATEEIYGIASTVSDLVSALHDVLQALVDYRSLHPVLRWRLEALYGAVPHQDRVGATRAVADLLNADSSEESIDLARAQVRVVRNHHRLI
jgi:hypothetical protein